MASPTSEKPGDEDDDVNRQSSLRRSSGAIAASAAS